MSSLLPLLGVWLLVVMTPGPDFLVVVHHATSRSTRHGMLAGLGITAGLMFWITGSMVGLAVLMARLSWMYHLVRLAGAGYLLYLGARMLWSTLVRRPSPGATRRPEAARRSSDPEGGSCAPGGAGAGLLRSGRVGFLTNIGNPKAMAFFGSLFGVLLPRHTGPAGRVELAVVMVLIVAVWYTCVAALFGLPAVVRAYRRARRWIDRAVAVVLIGLAGRIALER